jgi:hypothetical protein
LYKEVLVSSSPDVGSIIAVNRSETNHYYSKFPVAPSCINVLAGRLAELSALPDRIIESLHASKANPDLHEALVALFFGKKDANGRLRPTGQIAFDMLEATIYTAAIRNNMESALAMKTESGIGEGAGEITTCSLAGTKQRRHMGKFPNPMIPVVATAGIAMFSMFSDAQTNTRYGRSGDGIVVIGEATVQAAQDGIKYVTSDEMHRKSWVAFPNGKSKKGRELADLLIAYAKGIDTDFAGLFVDPPEPEQSFEDTVRPVFEALEGVAKLRPKAEVILVLLRQISNAQVQSVYCRTPLVSAVFEAGKRWVDAQRGRPMLVTDRRGPARPRRFISQASAVHILGQTWNGKPPKSIRLNGPSGGDLLDFFLATGPERSRTADALLPVALQRLTSLLVFSSEERRKKAFDRIENTDPPLILEADRAAFFLALLLDAKDRNMEITTRSPAYLVGLLLALVDTLHLAYCKVVRRDVPPTLGGAQLLGIAADNPQRALCDLLERIRPWQAWAETAEPKGDESDVLVVLRAKKTLVRLASVSPLLVGKLPQSLEDLQKAELLLGFLSRDAQADQFSDNSTAKEPIDAAI